MFHLLLSRKVLVLFAVGLIGLVFAFIAEKTAIYYGAKSYVDELAEMLDLNIYAARALTITTFGILVSLLGLLFSVQRRRRVIGFMGVLSLLVAHSIVLWQGTASHLFDRTGTAIRCYVLTKEHVRYSERPGIDPETGRECRELTPQMVERLRAYERGLRPTLIRSNDVTFFDPRTGEPLVWFYIGKTNEIELYDLMGFHPETGKELLPVTASLVDQFNVQRTERERQRALLERRPPQRVDLDEYAPFDPVTGKPRTWYWMSPAGDYEFFDNEGFHPQTGDSLTEVTKEAINAWREAVERRKKQEEEEERRKEEERRQAELEREREEERLRTEAAELQNIAGRCDELAANPTDPQKSPGVHGVVWDELKLVAAEAVKACTAAVEIQPDVARYKYQLARALQIISFKKAIPLYEDLVLKNYSAAFDNYAWTLIQHDRDYRLAEKYLRMGAALNNADAMQTLGELIQRGKIRPKFLEEDLELLARAAELGNADAQKFVEEYAEQQRRAAEGRAIMKGVFQGILGRALR